MATAHPMTAAEVDSFAAEWIAAWSRNDIEAVLSHFAEDVRFTSPKALARMGKATVQGKQELAEYWEMARTFQIAFTLDRALWDERHMELTIIYTAEINGQRHRACETMRFNADGLVIEGEALYGVAV